MPSRAEWQEIMWPRRPQTKQAMDHLERVEKCPGLVAEVIIPWAKGDGTLYRWVPSLGTASQWTKSTVALDFRRPTDWYFLAGPVDLTPDARASLAVPESWKAGVTNHAMYFEWLRAGRPSKQRQQELAAKDPKPVALRYFVGNTEVSVADATRCHARGEQVMVLDAEGKGYPFTGPAQAYPDLVAIHEVLHKVFFHTPIDKASIETRLHASLQEGNTHHAQEKTHTENQEIVMTHTIKKVVLLNGRDITTLSNETLVKTLLETSEHISNLRKVKATMPGHVSTSSPSMKIIIEQLEQTTQVYEAVVTELDNRG
jgi:hypothetical protein